MPRVLVVDDSLSVRKVVERTLQAEGLAVLLATSATEAKQRVERDAPDLVVCDVILPDLDGFEVCRYVKSLPRTQKTPVLLMSGVINARTREQADQARCDGLLPKPFAPEELVRTARELLKLNGHAPAPPAPAAPAVPATRVAAPAPSVSARLIPPPPPPTPPASPGILSALRGPAAPAPRAPAPAAPRPPAAAAPSAPPTAKGGTLQACLAPFVAIPGVQQALLMDREGFLVESATQPAAEAECMGAVTSSLGELFDGLAQDLSQGTLRRVILENEQGSVLFQIVKRSVMLVVILVDATALGRVRYEMKRVLPELIRAL